MRNIPLSLRSKLLNRIKSVSEDTDPHIRLIATQTSFNTLLTEPIHEDVAPNFGDVAIRQMMGDGEPALAYAFCIDPGGVATIRKRNFPALMDNPWEYVFTFDGSPTDVAIEFDGTWTLDGNQEYWYLLTTEYPYLFTVEGGKLYVQYWNDTDTRIQLATGSITQICACKGWKNSIDRTQDQGLIIGYIRNGAVYYRALCEQADGSVVWETERQVTDLGSGNSTLSIFRTNDFRIGFLTEKNGSIKCALSERTYAGMSVKPETVTAYTTRATLTLTNLNSYSVSNRERAEGNQATSYINLYRPDEDSEISVTGYERIDLSVGLVSYGIKIFLSKPIGYRRVSDLQSAISITGKLGNNAPVPIEVTNAYFDDDECCIVVNFDDLSKLYALTVNIASTHYVFYERVQHQKWFIPEMSVYAREETNDHYVEEKETVTGTQANVSFSYVGIETKTGYAPNETVSGTQANTVITLEPTSVDPI